MLQSLIALVETVKGCQAEVEDQYLYCGPCIRDTLTAMLLRCLAAHMPLNLEYS